jgi:putative ABC transport system permease protein
MGELFRRIRYLMHRRRFDAELASDMEFHRDMAARAGCANFGNALRIEQQAREVWGWTWLDDLLHDLRYAWRMLLRSPGFSVIAILTLALGIGATTAIFSVIDATLLHQLPFPDSQQVVRIEDDLPGIGASDAGISIPEFWDLQRSGIFQYVSLHGGGSVNLTGTAQPARIQFEPVTPAYFALLGIKPEFGRTFDPNDPTLGFTLEVVISDALWRRDFGSDPQILGRSLRLDNDTYRVVGIMPRGFHDPGRTPGERNTELWAGTGFAAAPAPDPVRGTRLRLGTIARLKPGLTLAAAQSRLDALVSSLKKQYPADYPPQADWTVRMSPVSESVFGNLRQSLLLLFSAVGLMLLVGCVNIANLMLARASSRSREIAVRHAIGATRGRLMRQLLTESLLLSIMGGIGGVLTLALAKPLLLHMIPESFPRLNEISVNWAVLGFALVVSIGAGTIFGLAPVRLARQLDVVKAIRQEGRSSTPSADRARARSVLVITEFALSLVLMIAAGLLLRSFWQLYKVQLGFSPGQVLSVQTWLPVPNDPTTDIYRTATQEAVLLREILRRNAALPGVEEVAIGDLAALPLGHGRDDLNMFPFVREGHEIVGNQAPLVQTSIVSPGYFHLLRMTLLRGRGFSDQDLETTPLVAVVNQAMAHAFWPSDDPIGKRFRLNRKGWITVAGLVADARTESPTQAGIPQIFLSLYQQRAKDLAILLRGQLDTGAIAAQVREQVQSVDPELPVFGAEPLDTVLSDSLSARRFSLQIVGLFAITALLLAGLGIYGTISYVVGEQTREIGVRLALGADRRAILTMVLSYGLRLSTIGAAFGMAGALLITRLMSGMLYGVSPIDPPTFLGVTVVLTTVALGACYIPARRATRVDPLTALHYE